MAYPLISCPAPDAATYLLVNLEADGARTVLATQRTNQDSASLNLARIRLEGARLGANEVHLHVLGQSDAERAQLQLELIGATLMSGGSRVAEDTSKAGSIR